MWQDVASVPSGLMKTKEGLCYRPNQEGLSKANFSEDRNELVRLANLILTAPSLVHTPQEEEESTLPSEKPKKSTGPRP